MTADRLAFGITYEQLVALQALYARTNKIAEQAESVAEELSSVVWAIHGASESDEPWLMRFDAEAEARANGD
jgi:hypothetical protein